jgi:hypothetical protein
MAILPCTAQEGPWYEPFFIETAAQYYFTPELFSEFVRPDPGFRLALGYEFRHFRFALEAGYTHITGTNPLVLDLKFFPLILKAGYSQPILWGLGVQADLGFGFLFSRVEHYQNAINLLMEKKSDSSAVTPLGAARLYLTYTFPFRFLKLYVGGGADFLFENDGIIPLPLIEAGISFSPLMLIRKKDSRPASLSEFLALKPEEIPEPVPLAQGVHDPGELTAEEDGRKVRFFSVVYFLPDLAVLIESYRNILDEAGERLRDDHDLHITLRGYAAPIGTEESCMEVSEARTRFCMDYLIRNFGIAEERIFTENYGMKRAPELADVTL